MSSMQAVTYENITIGYVRNRQMAKGVAVYDADNRWLGFAGNHDQAHAILMERYALQQRAADIAEGDGE
jgi:hypothetical protein